MDKIKNEARDMDIIIKEYRSQQQENWKKIIEDWEKQCQIWIEIDPMKNGYKS